MTADRETYCQQLQRSFAAIYAALEVPRNARRTVAVLLFIHTGLLAYSAYVHSPTANEPGHLVAGLSNWRFGRFEIYNVNPPLVRMVAALPVMAVGCNEDWSGFYQGPGARPEMNMGDDFVKANGERSSFLFMIARWACIPFSWLGAIVCYLWARDLYGRPSGVMACAIWSFEPNILAHASLITSDVGATSLGIAACYSFWRWLKEPTWTQAALTGVVLGLAELSKTTLILFYPLWPLMWLIYRWPNRKCFGADDWFREVGMLILRMFVGAAVLNLGYCFEGSFTPLREFVFVSDLFKGNVGKMTKTTDEVSKSAKQEEPSKLPANRFSNIWLGAMPVPFPKNYLLGIDTQQKDFEHYGRLSYLRGEWRDRGWWYYYLYACTIKVPLGLWILGGFALLARTFLGLRKEFRDGSLPHSGGSKLIVGAPQNGRRTSPVCGAVAAALAPPTTIDTVNFDEEQQTVSLATDSKRLTTSIRDELMLVFPALAIFTLVSCKTGFSEHMRYVLPTFPFVFIWISQVACEMCRCSRETSLECLTLKWGGLYTPFVAKWGTGLMPLLSTTLVVILGSWFVVSSLWIYPHSLSYFNEVIGGPVNGPKYLLGSNVDWGQDLGYVYKWRDRTISPIADASFLLVNQRVAPWENPNLRALDAGTGTCDPDVAAQTMIVVSVNVLYGQLIAAGSAGKGVYVPRNALRQRLKDSKLSDFGYSCRVLSALKESNPAGESASESDRLETQ